MTQPLAKWPNFRIVRPVPDSTDRYLARDVDARMLRVISEHLAGAGHVLDAGCGAGQYGEHLARIAGAASGADMDPVLCETARHRASYSHVENCTLADVAALGSFDAVFCSEVLEHITNAEFQEARAAIEAATDKIVVITVPHPRAPHFKEDETHVLNYTVRSFAKMLNVSEKFSYQGFGIGFHDKFQQHPVIRVLEPIARRTVHLSPTLLFVGHRR
jgi:SAM-dependent methyltransferase